VVTYGGHIDEGLDCERFIVFLWIYSKIMYNITKSAMLVLFVNITSVLDDITKSPSQEVENIVGLFKSDILGNK